MTARYGLHASTAPGLRVDFCTAAPGEEEWRTLASALHPHSRFVTAAWIDAWGRNFLPYRNWRPPMRYLTVRDGDGQLQAVFPFATQRQSGISVASLGGLYWPFRSPVLPERSGACVFEALADAFTRSGTTFALRYGPVPEMHPGIAGLNLALENRGWRMHRFRLGETYAVSLPDTWQQFERSLGKSLQANIGYYERKMRREGELDIRRIQNTGGSSWSEAIRDLGTVEANSWQYREGGTLRFLGERNLAFWTGLLPGSGTGDGFSVWLMYFNGEPVSFCFFLDCADIRYIVANNYAEQVHGYSTGSVLYKYVFRDAIESGISRSVNIGMGDSGYKGRWGGTPSFRLVDWIAFRPGLRGGVLDLVQRMRRNVGKRGHLSDDATEQPVPLAVDKA